MDEIENVILCERNKTQNNTYSMVPFIERSKAKKLNHGDD